MPLSPAYVRRRSTCLKPKVIVYQVIVWSSTTPLNARPKLLRMGDFRAPGRSFAVGRSRGIWPECDENGCTLLPCAPPVDER